VKTNIRWNSVLKKNYYQVLFVFAAFLIMVMAGYFFVSGILRNRILANAGDNLFSAEANIRAAFAESEISLNNLFPIILGMIERDAPQEEILEYLKFTTTWMRQNKGIMEFYGTYGYIRGEYLDGLGFQPDDTFVPQARPWYQTAVRTGDTAVVYTAPYRDMQTGETIISAVKNIVDGEKNYHGILVIDMNMKWINEYIKTLQLGNGGYGMIVSQNMAIVTHPDQNTLGKQLQELGKPFDDISRRLRAGEEISALLFDTPREGRVITFFKQMFNGWYVGLVTPTRAYYRELRYAAYLLSGLGFVLMCALSYLLLRINAAKMAADENSLSKSTFLARMSHEIRTPMNAIIGMGELILREELSPSVRSYTDSIRQAGSSLLAIINDILDFSKIEAGRLDIINADYQLASIINDVIAIIRMRLNEKPIRLVTKIDGSLPAVLTGDEVRVRQVLLNLLTNAVKYTKEGSITFSISRRDGPEDPARARHDGGRPRVFLAFEVADTGIGIKKEDMEKLFEDFIQFDHQQNRGVEGTGLGLVISRSLCHLMGGDITVKSEYGRGSVFTALMPQFVRNEAPFALVKHPESKAALVYEDRPLYAESLVFTITSLGADCLRARSRREFIEGLPGRRFVFTSPSLLEEAREILDRDRESRAGEGSGGASGREDPALILLTEDWQFSRPDIQAVFTPLQPVAVANILNGQNDSKAYQAEGPGIRFTAPGIRVLIVDDIEINLDVAEGLLSPYQMIVDRAAGGLEAVQLVQENHYDLVLMDHMMPGMDGVEAVAAIRSWEEKSAPESRIPIVALTANAISGMKEMFLEKGFSDYLSKPIEIAKLDDMIGRWIPQEKRKKTNARFERNIFTGDSGMIIPGVDTKKGINMTGGTEAGYRKVLAQFIKDASKRLEWFKELSPEKIQKEGDSGGDLAAFTTQVHALKSAAGTIGAAEISKEAAVLEAAGKAGDTAAVRRALPKFIDHLNRLIGGIGKILETKSAPSSPLAPGSPVPRAAVSALEDALKSKNMKEIDRLLAELELAAADAETREWINAISDKVLMGEYPGALEEIRRFGAEDKAGF
jgi:signal transduction histidine kinase/CheY-like chemotaxis protein